LTKKLCRESGTCEAEYLELHLQTTVSIPADKELYRRQIATTDRQIDALAYELYSLTEEEIKIVAESR
jgi:hypothetical protein